MAATLFIGLGSSVYPATRIPYFLVFSDNTPLREHVRRLTAAGVHVRHSVPPRVLVVDSASPLSSSSFDGLEKVYSSAVPSAELEPLGLVAVAAGRQWNKEMLTRAKTSGPSAFSAMSASLSQDVLPAPVLDGFKDMAASAEIRWKPVPGGVLYHIQASRSPDFKTLLAETHTERTSVEIPVNGENVGRLYFRVRAMDRSSGMEPAPDLIGAWAAWDRPLAPRPIPTENISAPTLYSPAEGVRSSGFLMILEWGRSGSGPTRVQVSPTASFTTTLVDEIVHGQELALPASRLQTGTMLHWRVQKWGDARSSWSVTRSFDVSAPEAVHNDSLINPERPQ